MFADDMLLLSETPEGLQTSIDKFSDYCDDWQLRVNINKTKTMIFSNRNKDLSHITFKYKNDILEHVKEFKFLGNLITQNGNLQSSAEALAKKALKVMYSIKSYTSSLAGIPAKLSTHLFDSLVRPILTYNCEVWYMDVYRPYYNASNRAKKNKHEIDKLSFIEKTSPEKVHNRFCKYTLGLKKNASNIASRSELGRYPIDCYIKTQSLLYEDRLLGDDVPGILRDCYTVSKFLHNEGIFSWFSYVNHLRNDIQIDTNNTLSKQKMKTVYKLSNEQFFRDNYNIKISNIDSSSKLEVFKKVKKSDYEIEYYLNFPDFETKRLISKFRTSDHPLAIETGRYKNIPRNSRLCNNCQVIEDETHFFLTCKNNQNLREHFFESLYTEYNDFSQNKLEYILNPKTCRQVNSLGSFIKRSLELRTGGT